MKHTLALLALIFTSSVFALEIPVGSYVYSSSKVSFLKDVQVLQLRKEADRIRLEDLRANKYQCRRYPNQVAKCAKFLKDHTGLVLPTTLLRELAPTFDSAFETELLSESDYISAYEVEQTVTVKDGVTDRYKLYVNHGGKSYADMLLRGHVLRFGYENIQSMSMQLVMRKTKGKGHWIEYGVLANYSQN